MTTFQVELVPLLRLCRQQPPSCADIQSVAMASHRPCYLTPYRGFSVCKIPPTDWISIFFTVKRSLKTSKFLETMMILIQTVEVDCGHKFIGSIEGASLLTLAVDRVNRPRLRRRLTSSEETEHQNDEDRLAHDIIASLSKELEWSGGFDANIDWYAYSESSGGAEEQQLLIQVRRRQFICLSFCKWKNPGAVQQSKLTKSGLSVTLKEYNGRCTININRPILNLHLADVLM